MLSTLITGTITDLLTPRKNDKSKEGFNDWSLMSVHTWAEDPRGPWAFTLQDLVLS